MGHGRTHGMIPLDENPKWVDKRIKCNPMSQLKIDTWCKTRENFNFSEKWQNGNFDQNPEFF